MPEYIRAFQPGGTFFFTAVTHQRARFLTSLQARTALRRALEKTQRELPFTIFAIVLMPDHLHCIWTLPAGDADFSTRWRLVKSRFSIGYGGAEGRRSESRRLRGERGYWQRRFWEHTILNERELEQICDYIHYNPVRHGLVKCPHEWKYSSLRRLEAEGYYEDAWLCSCKRSITPPNFDEIRMIVGE